MSIMQELQYHEKSGAFFISMHLKWNHLKLQSSLQHFIIGLRLSSFFLQMQNNSTGVFSFAWVPHFSASVVRPGLIFLFFTGLREIEDEDDLTGIRIWSLIRELALIFGGFSSSSTLEWSSCEESGTNLRFCLLVTNFFY